MSGLWSPMPINTLDNDSEQVTIPTLLSAPHMSRESWMPLGYTPVSNSDKSDFLNLISVPLDEENQRIVSGLCPSNKAPRAHAPMSMESGSIPGSPLASQKSSSWAG